MTTSGTGLSSRVLFWAMFAVVVIPFLGFFWQSFDLLRSNLNDINSSLGSEAARLLADTDELNEESTRLAFLTKAWVALEHDIMMHRQQRTDWAFAARTSVRFMSLIFGAVLITSGTVFVLGRVAAPRTDANFQWQDVKVSFMSSSPGLAMIILGCLLIFSSEYNQAAHLCPRRSRLCEGGERHNYDRGFETG